MKKRLVTVPALGVLFALAAVGCSADDSSAKLDGWAKSVCDGAKDPIAQSKAALADTADVKQGEAPVDLQKRLSTDLASLATTNQQLADAVQKAGAPKIDDGAKVQQDAVNELKQVAQGYLDAQKKLDGLTSADQAKFADGLRSVGDQVQQLSQVSISALATLQSGGLGEAMKKQPGCKAGAVTAGTGASADPSAAPTGGAGATGTAAPGESASPADPAASGSPSGSGSTASGSASASGSPSLAKS
ncbi:small secreted protein [Kitasatospora sp. SolWspMP-SS2h]|uniref:small secreted protein n=1 Tax=Kitasatospora sp. SolWspMP-SS2h TaxID=1305729 RepID=UPI000DB966E7|nr:small secreted protein [Kitasatospora sp. SolWspMP-SS2h]